MSVVVVLIGASLLVAIGFLIAYLWAVKSGQYDDKYTPSVRILFENKKLEDRSRKIEERGKKSDNADDANSNF
ncbi:MAG: cbb3-type cytochrome oxidase assembly protein CcoS [Bacteroidetes bacterium]|nr:cbb3-type cytochrome oxidase assembly protein CcoS [Bacteroidota bacterium]MCL6098839.1 cbb3-type cytochrome oxidase assembly protein CcoS [Bacteroidota bacterium]